jgi:hypothetical protein
MQNSISVLQRSLNRSLQRPPIMDNGNISNNTEHFYHFYIISNA